MIRLAPLTAIAALGAASLAFGQPADQAVPQPQPGPSAQTSEAPPPPSRDDPSMTTMQQPISGNSNATSPPHSMAPNAADTDTRLAAILPQGMSAQQACSGFRSTRECAATVHAAHNLKISFTDLKSRVSGGQQLEAAIHDLKPDVNAESQAQRAEQEAKTDLEQQPPQG